MRKIIVSMFVSMDGILQGPGGPQEDTTNNFNLGGWIVNYWDNTLNEILTQSMSQQFDLLLGRFTYDIWAAYWPYKNDHIGQKFNQVHKYVVSSQQLDLTWANSTLITGDVVANLKKLKASEGADLLVNGSGKLIQTLLANKLVDDLRILTFPVTLGKGKRLFAEGTQPYDWKLEESKVSTTGVIITKYIPKGEVKPGSFVEEEVSEQEVARRKSLEGK